MSTRSHALLILAPLIFITVSAQADGPMPATSITPLTLEQAVQGFETSPSAELANSMKEEVSWKRVESVSGFMPKITANATRILDDKLVLVDIPLNGTIISIPQIIPTTTYSLGVDWTLFDGLANFERYQGARAYESAAQKDLAWVKFQGDRDVVLLFYRALAAQTLKDVADSNLKTLQDHLNDVRLFKQAGAGTKFDVLRVEVQTSEARSEVLNQSDNVTISKLRLGEQLGQDMAGRSLQGQLPVLSPELASNITYDETRRGDLEARKARVEGAERNSSAANRFLIPKVSIGGQYQQYNNLTNDLTGTGFRTAYSAALNLQWNLYDGGVSYSRDRQAVEQKVQAEKSLIIAKQKARDDFEYWRRRYIYNASVYQSRVEDVQKSTESVRLAKEGRRVGTRTNTDLLDAETELFRARAGLVNSQIGAIEALINLEVATGQTLFNFK
jgi:outer membrane protein TolC